MRKKITFIFLLLSSITGSSGDYITVSDPSTVIRVLPHDDAFKLGTATKGDSFKVFYKQGDWYHIEYNKLPAWLHSKNTAPAESADTGALQQDREAPPPEPSPAAHRAGDAPKPMAVKPADQMAAQNFPKRGAETVWQKKASERGQSRQGRPHESAPGAADTVMSTMPRQDSAAAPEVATRTAQGEGAESAKGQSGALNIPYGIIAIALGLLGLVLVVALVIRKLSKPRKQQLKIKRMHFGMDALIIANAKINVANPLTNSSIPITDFLTEMGFKVHFYSDLNNAKTYLLHYVPDLVVVDWKLEDGIHNAIASILSGSKAATGNVVLFYNVPDLSPTLKKSDTNINAHFFGSTLSDQDISKIVVPLFKIDKKEKRFKESIQATALEGEIQEGNLAEVLQFIGMGRKTGCLYVVDAKGESYGLVYFEQGQVVYAMSPSLKGINAVLEMLDLTAGHFHFVMDKVSPNKNSNHSCLEIVVEWTRIHDEAARHQQPAPTK